MTACIELSDIRRTFGTNEVLRDVNVSVNRGETLVLIGESGCGKSVTMKLMMGLMQPSAGHVKWEGRSIDALSPTAIRSQRMKFGYLFQGAALFDSLTVFENVAFGLRENRRMPEREIEQVVHERLDEVGLDANVCSRKPAELSGGMKKRVALARALALQPEVMFYDEPTTGLDPIMSDVIDQLILSVRTARRVTSIVVTHDMRTVQKIADRVVMFYPRLELPGHESQVIFNGSVDQLMRSSEPRVARFVRGDANYVQGVGCDG